MTSSSVGGSTSSTPRRCRSTSSTLAVLGLLAGFVNVDAFRIAPVTAGSRVTRRYTSVRGVASSSASSARPRNPVSVSAWRAASGRLSMSTLSATDHVAATGEKDGDKPGHMSVMDELDAILNDVQAVRGYFWFWNPCLFHVLAWSRRNGWCGTM